MNERSDRGEMDTLTKIVVILVIFLVFWNIYKGATVQQIGIPPAVIIFTWGTPTPTSTTAIPVDTLSGRYSMDNDMSRIIIITSTGGNYYTISQPDGAWPWRGTGTLNGDQFTGTAASTVSPASFRIEGTVSKDRSIDVNLVFIKNSDGTDATGRVDHHIFLRIS